MALTANDKFIRDLWQMEQYEPDMWLDWLLRAECADGHEIVGEPGEEHCRKCGWSKNIVYLC